MLKDVWNGPVGKIFRQIYVAAAAAGLMAAWNALFSLQVDQEKWPWWAAFLAVAKAVDVLVRTAINNIAKTDCDAKNGY